MSQIVGQDKRSHQYAFITLALSINLLKILASAQISLHERLKTNSEQGLNVGVPWRAFV
jgi:hypothetical protein